MKARIDKRTETDTETETGNSKRGSSHGWLASYERRRSPVTWNA